MKIFYTTSADAVNQKSKRYTIALSLLRDQLGKKNVFSPEERKLIKRSENDKEASESVNLKEKQLKECDLVIADITDGTAGVGYFISTALFLKKPTLVIQEESASMHEIHDSITTGKNRLLTYKTYKDLENELTGILKEFVNKAKQQLDTKFILIIPAEIDRYLEWASDYKRMHKAQIVRNAIEEYMEKDSDWQEFLSED